MFRHQINQLKTCIRSAIKWKSKGFFTSIRVSVNVASRATKAHFVCICEMPAAVSEPFLSRWQSAKCHWMVWWVWKSCDSYAKLFTLVKHRITWTHMGNPVLMSSTTLYTTNIRICSRIDATVHEAVQAARGAPTIRHFILRFLLFVSRYQEINIHWHLIVLLTHHQHH